MQACPQDRLTWIYQSSENLYWAAHAFFSFDMAPLTHASGIYRACMLRLCSSTATSVLTAAAKQQNCDANAGWSCIARKPVRKRTGNQNLINFQQCMTAITPGLAALMHAL